MLLPERDRAVADALDAWARVAERLARTRPRSAIARVDGWAGMARAGWTLLDHFEQDGKQIVIASRDGLAALDSLTARERQVIGARLLGHTNKIAAHELGLSASTVRVLLARALKKLGARSLAELAQLAGD